MKGPSVRDPGRFEPTHVSRPRERSLGTPVTELTPELSVIVPVFNEGANVEALVARLRPVLDRCVVNWEVVFVDDGSRDDTLLRLRRLHDVDPRYRAIAFSRNFGKEIAIAA